MDTPVLDTAKALDIRSLQVVELSLKNKIMELQIQHANVQGQLGTAFRAADVVEGFKLDPNTLKFSPAPRVPAAPAEPAA